MEDAFKKKTKTEQELKVYEELGLLLSESEGG